MTTPNTSPIIDQLHREQKPTAVQAIYNSWATDYDQDLEQLGYHGPQVGAETLRDHLSDKSALILDAGCGTGLTGEALFELGYKNLHGIDYAPNMLGIAAAKGCYSDLFQADFQKTLELKTASYDALICIGVIGPRVWAAVLKEFVRIVKPSGYICFSIRVAWEEAHGTNVILEDLVQEGLINHIATHQKRYMDEQQAEAFYHILQVL